MAKKIYVEDKELARYRGILDTPTEFKSGFGWSSVVAILFCGLLIMPGSIYLGLMTGGGLGGVASWVTVILFCEVSRRAMKPLPKEQIVVLLHVAGMMAAAPAGDLIWRAYFVNSDPVRDAGMANAFPWWWCPAPNSAAITERNLFHRDWWPIYGLVLLGIMVGLVKRYTLGYFLFRLCSDIEKLPFPMAPVSAQGALALAEMDEKAPDPKSVAAGETAPKKSSGKWRLFSLGAMLGVTFGFIQIGIPALSGLILDKPFYLIPQPWVELTPLTESILPATPTGIAFDLGVILVGMVVPFWAIVGSFAAIVLTMIANPLLHHFGVLTHWKPGMDTINTTFSNGMDFYTSFGMGTALAIACISIYSTVRDVRQKMRDLKEKARREPETKRQNIWGMPDVKGRGDIPLWLSLVGYVFVGTYGIVVCYFFLRNHSYGAERLLPFLFFFIFIYNPFISYVNARLVGISAQGVDIPFVRETAFILSGIKGVSIWLAPIPIENCGGQAQSFRVGELTGVRFDSYLKADAIAMPLMWLLSLVFWSFIWKANAIPSDAFPYTQKMWDLKAKNTALLYSSTHVAPGEDPKTKSIMDSQFVTQAIHKEWIMAGAGWALVLYIGLNLAGLPVMMVYGMIRGLGAIPHTMVLEIVGAIIGRFFFWKKFGDKKFLQMMPTIMAGYFTGVGLISMATIAMNLIQAAVSSAPF